jgi:phosphate transport system permease protein
MSTISLKRNLSRSRLLKENFFRGLVSLSILFALGFILFVVFILFLQSRGALNLDLFRNFPSARPQNAGIQSAVFGSIWVVGIAALVAVPIGVIAAVFLEEFINPNNRIAKIIDLNVRNLAGVPAVVFGMVGLAFIARGPLGWGFTVGTAALVLAMMILPVVIIVSRESIRAVPSSLRDGSLALGATQWQTVWRTVMPSALPSIATGAILSVSRAMGESAPLLLLGALAFVTYNPESLDSDYTILPLIIFRYASDAKEEFHAIAAATSLVLMAILFLMNLTAILIRDRSQRKA